MHLSEEQLNEYLDNELAERADAEKHLAECVDCTARLAALQALFNEIESLPEIALSRSLREASLWGTARFTRDQNLPTTLPRSLRLTVILQAAFTVGVIIVAAPFVLQFISPYFSSLQALSFGDIFLQLQSQWIAWLDVLSQIQLPTIPEFPVIEIPSLVINLTLTGVSVLWLVGNGLLLRHQIK